MSLLSENQGMCQVELVDLAVELPNVNPTVVLRERGGQRRECWFPIGQADGVTLSMAWRGTPTPRPLTHELMADIFVRFGLGLDVVRITGCAGKTFLAELVMSRSGERQVVACRPSDALALSLRRLVPVPIMVAEELMQPGSLPPDEGLTEFPNAWPFDTTEPETWPPAPWAVPAPAELHPADSGPQPDPAEPDPAEPTEPDPEPGPVAEPAVPAERAHERSA
ncbi:MAG: bifunctional nuclease domain-containing protein [Acidimicrobiales bacterium]